MLPIGYTQVKAHILTPQEYRAMLDKMIIAAENGQKRRVIGHKAFIAKKHTAEIPLGPADADSWAKSFETSRWISNLKATRDAITKN